MIVYIYELFIEAITDFTKSKISDLIIERDNYKNRLEEVQEAFRWTEMLRATKYDQLNRGTKQHPIQELSKMSYHLHIL